MEHQKFAYLPTATNHISVEPVPQPDPTVKQAVLDVLDAQGITYELEDHPAVFTIDEMAKLSLAHPECVAKNLFVRDDKKRNYYLITVREDKRVHLERFRTQMGLRRLSFASETDLSAILGLTKGSVTPFGILNDTDCRVHVYLDEDFRDGLIGVHPNLNTATVWLRTRDLENVLRQHGNVVEYAQFPMYPCPCCGCRTYTVPYQEDIGYICPVCFWENEALFLTSDEEPSDCNHGLTLNQARENYRTMGACCAEMLPHVRPPLPGECPVEE